MLQKSYVYSQNKSENNDKITLIFSKLRTLSVKVLNTVLAVKIILISYTKNLKEAPLNLCEDRDNLLCLSGFLHFRCSTLTSPGIISKKGKS